MKSMVHPCPAHIDHLPLAVTVCRGLRVRAEALQAPATPPTKHQQLLLPTLAVDGLPLVLHDDSNTASKERVAGMLAAVPAEPSSDLEKRVQELMKVRQRGSREARGLLA